MLIYLIYLRLLGKAIETRSVNETFNQALLLLDIKHIERCKFLFTQHPNYLYIIKNPILGLIKIIENTHSQKEFNPY